MRNKKMLLWLITVFACLFLCSCSMHIVEQASSLGVKEYDKRVSDGIRWRNFEEIKEAIEDGADINSICVGPLLKVNPCVYAMRDSAPKVAKYLIELGADVNYADKDDVTLLMTATQRGDKDVCQLLLERGAKIDSKDKDGYTALDCAIEGADDDLEAKTFMDLYLAKGLKFTPVSLKAALDSSENVSCKYAMVQRVLKGLLKEGGKSGLDPLLEAAILGDSSKVDQLISEGKLNEDNEKQVLFCTAAFGDMSTIELLQKNGAHINECDNDVNPPLTIAALYGNLKMMEYYIGKGADLEFKNSSDQQTALIKAAHYNQYEAVKLLIQHGANMAPYKESAGFTLDVLCEAAGVGNLDMVKFILKNGYVLDHEALERALNAAAYYNRVEILRYFMDQGADPDTEYDSSTLLETACLMDNMDAVKYLVGQGAAVNGKDNDGGPIICAVDYSNMEILKYLIAKGADVNATPIYNEGINEDSALTDAILGGKLDKVQLLIKHGADLEYPVGKTRDTAVITATMQLSRHVLDYVLQKGANINYQNTNGQTALMIAVANGLTDNVKILLQYHPALDLQEKNGLTALDIAKKNKQQDMIELLENAQ